MTTYTIPAELLQELISNCMASIAEDGISDARRVYRTELHHRANLAMRNLQPNTQEPCDFKSWISEAYREPHTTFTIHNMEVAFCAGRVAAHGVKP